MRMFAAEDKHICCITHPSLQNKCQIHVCYKHLKQQILNTLNPSEHMVKCVHGANVLETGLQMFKRCYLDWSTVFRKVGDRHLMYLIW